MGSETVYNVKVKYALDDKASKGAGGLASSFDKANSSAMSLKGALAAIGGVALFAKGKEALIDFNSEIQQMQIGLTAVMQMQLHMPFAKAKDEANKLFGVFQQMAQKSPATTKDFMEMANAIAPAVGLAGGGPEKLAKLTQGAVVASLAFGERADVVGRDIKQMLMGTVGQKDPLAMQLLGSQKISAQDFNAMDSSKRAAKIEELLGNDAIKNAADQMGESFAGQTSTLKDTLQIALGQVGKPLMASMTEEVAKWNKFIERHPKLISEYVGKFSTMIKGAFEFVRTAVGWLVDNRDLLMTVAKTFLVFKGAQMGANIFKRFADGVGGLIGDVKNAGGSIKDLFSGGSGGIFKGVMGFAGALGPAATAVTLFTGALDLAWQLLNQHREDDIKAQKAQMDIHEAVGDMPAMQARKSTLEAMLAGKGIYSGLGDNMPKDMRARTTTELENIKGQLYDPQKLGETLRKISDESEKHGGSGFKSYSVSDIRQSGQNALPEMFDFRDVKKSRETADEVMRFLTMFKNLDTDTANKAMQAAFPEQYGALKAEKMPEPAAGWGGTESPKINVNITKIEVASEDPDRFVFGLAKVGEQAARHPTASIHSTPGGF